MFQHMKHNAFFLGLQKAFHTVNQDFLIEQIICIRIISGTNCYGCGHNNKNLKYTSYPI